MLQEVSDTEPIYIWRALSKKRSLDEMMKPEIECKKSDSGYAVPHEVEEDFNKKHVDSTFMILYLAEKVYYGCFFDPSLYELQLLEPISRSNEDDEILTTLINQFEPDLLICNSKVKFQIDSTSNKLNHNLRIDVKTNREFNFIEGKAFTDQLMKLNTEPEKQEVSSFQKFLCRFETSDNCHHYVRSYIRFELFRLF